MKIITGVSGSIGKLLFDHYGKTEDSVIGIYNKHKPEVEKYNRVFKVDISDYSEVSDFIERIKTDLNEICLINCASIVYDSFAHKSNPELWKEVIDTNLTGTFYMIRGLLPFMRDQEYGRIINFSSVVAQSGAIGTTAYAASKAGLWGLSKSLAIENANKNVLINTLNLGYMDVGMTYSLPEEMQLDIRNNIPLKKFGSQEEIIYAIDYLLASGYVTGTTIDINGGLY
jgi:NAD(P)-dependent dehydrogenase (short-subunit alcohol dehydrogenase family)